MDEQKILEIVLLDLATQDQKKKDAWLIYDHEDAQRLGLSLPDLQGALNYLVVRQLARRYGGVQISEQGLKWIEDSEGNTGNGAS